MAKSQYQIWTFLPVAGSSGKSKNRANCLRLRKNVITLQPNAGNSDQLRLNMQSQRTHAPNLAIHRGAIKCVDIALPGSELPRVFASTRKHRSEPIHKENSLIFSPSRRTQWRCHLLHFLQNRLWQNLAKIHLNGQQSALRVLTLGI
jgi:hypothetical protein